MPPPTVADLLENNTSEFLRTVIQNDPMYSEILLTDRVGRLVAASNVPTDYYQADEPWWRDVVAAQRLQMSDVRWDESAATYAIEISVPVYAPGSTALAGVVKAATNSSGMLAAVSLGGGGAGGTATLVRRDGSVVYAGRGVEPGTPFFAAGLFREALGLTALANTQSALEQDRATDPQFRTYFSAQGPDGQPTLVALAPMQLGLTFPQLPWLVALSRTEAELFAPVEAQIQYFLLLLALVALVTLALALWLSIRLAAPLVDAELDMHLVEHPALHRIDEETT